MLSLWGNLRATDRIRRRQLAARCPSLPAGPDLEKSGQAADGLLGAFYLGPPAEVRKGVLFLVSLFFEGEP